MRFNVDAMSLTFFALGPDEVRDAVERILHASTPFDEAFVWEEFEGGKMFSRAWSYGGKGGFWVKQGKGYVCLEAKGKACQIVQANLPRFFSEVKHNVGRVNVTRLDGAWAPMPFDIEAWHNAISSDQLVSSLRKHGASFMENDDGRTLYFPRYEARYKVDRFTRAYDKNGHTRLELELHGDDAVDCLRRIADEDVANWSEIWMQYLLRCVDFRVGDQKIVTQRRRADWWAAVVGDASKIKNLNLVETVPERSRAARWEGFKRRNAQTLYTGIMASGGWDKFREEMESLWATRKPHETHVESLRLELNPPPRPVRPPIASGQFLPFDGDDPPF